MHSRFTVIYHATKIDGNVDINLKVMDCVQGLLGWLNRQKGDFRWNEIAGISSILRLLFFGRLLRLCCITVGFAFFALEL